MEKVFFINLDSGSGIYGTEAAEHILAEGECRAG